MTAFVIQKATIELVETIQVVEDPSISINLREFHSMILGFTMVCYPFLLHFCFFCRIGQALPVLKLGHHRSKEVLQRAYVLLGSLEAQCSTGNCQGFFPWCYRVTVKKSERVKNKLHLTDGW